MPKTLPFLFCLCVMLCLALAVTLGGCDKDDPVRIGFSGQLVGEYADLGVAGRNGVTLAVEELNSKGGIAGRQIELLVRDDGRTPEAARQADAELLDEGVAGIVGHMTSGQTMAALSVTRERNAPLVSPTTSTTELRGMKDNFFRVQVVSDYNAAGLALFCRQKLGLERMALLMDMGNKSYIQSFSQSFSWAFRQDRGRIVSTKSFDASARPDWSQLLQEVVAAGAQGICIVAPATATAMLAQHARLLGLDLPLVSSGLARTSTFLEQGGKSVEGVYMTNSINSSREGYVDFAERYEKRFGRKALFAAVRGYEAAMLLAAGLERTGGRREGLVRALQDIRLIPGVDSVILLDVYGDCHRPSFIIQVQNGAFVNVESISSGAAP